MCAFEPRDLRTTLSFDGTGQTGGRWMEIGEKMESMMRGQASSDGAREMDPCRVSDSIGGAIQRGGVVRHPKALSVLFLKTGASWGKLANQGLLDGSN